LAGGRTPGIALASGDGALSPPEFGPDAKVDETT
jgi:hypothetical protein